MERPLCSNLSLITANILVVPKLGLLSLLLIFLQRKHFGCAKILDFRVYFLPKFWTLLFISCREEIPENVIQQHRYQIIRWLDDREAKSEETVTLAQFCDMLMNKPGVSREDAIRVC